jgi:hypothetical protein
MTLVGWCPAGRTVAEMLAMYPGTTAVRIFVGAGKPLPTWDGPVLGPIPAGVMVHVSFKTWDVPAVERWLTAMPAEHAPIILTYAHEPEQGTAAGDPTVEQFRTRWAELVAALADHPRRPDVLLVPVYTRYWWQAHANDLRWLVPMVDAYGWDVYNDGPTYRTPDDLLTIPRDIAKRTGLPYLIAELGGVRLASDKDGAGRAKWMRDMVAAAATDGAWTVCWFHKGNSDLAPVLTAAVTDPALERQTWQQLTQEASVAWSRGQQWRIVGSLERLNEQIRAAYPKAVPPATPAASWGAIADSAHSSTSDHYPHFYSALGKTAVVCARDFPHAPSLGLDAHALADQLRASRDSRIGYIISNGRITGPSHGWQWDKYSGSDPHDTHIHVSTVHTAAADDTRDWHIGEDDIMATLDDLRTVVRDELREALPFQSAGIATANPTVKAISARQLLEYAWSDARQANSGVAALRAAVAEMAGRDLVDEQAIVTGILAGLPAERIAAAIPQDLAKQVADELATRLQG